MIAVLPRSTEHRMRGAFVCNYLPGFVDVDIGHCVGRNLVNHEISFSNKFTEWNHEIPPMESRDSMLKQLKRDTKHCEKRVQMRTKLLSRDNFTRYVKKGMERCVRHEITRCAGHGITRNHLDAGMCETLADSA